MAKADRRIGAHHVEVALAGNIRHPHAPGLAKHYGKRYGSGSLGDVLGTIAAKNHRNGVDNPYAQLRKDLGEEFCRTVSDKNPMVADPLRRTDCSPVSDGAAAVVLSVAPTGGATAPVRLAGFGQYQLAFRADKRASCEQCERSSNAQLGGWN